MGELMGYVDQITSYGFSSTDLGNKAPAGLQRPSRRGTGWCESDEQSHRTGYAYSPEGQLIPGTLLGKGIPKIDLGNNAKVVCPLFLLTCTFQF